MAIIRLRLRPDSQIIIRLYPAPARWKKMLSGTSLVLRRFLKVTVFVSSCSDGGRLFQAARLFEAGKTETPFSKLVTCPWLLVAVTDARMQTGAWDDVACCSDAVDEIRQATTDVDSIWLAYSVLKLQAQQCCHKMIFAAPYICCIVHMQNIQSAAKIHWDSSMFKS